MASAGLGEMFGYPGAATLAVALIKRFEDLCLAPTADTGSRFQIGWGMNFLLDGTPVTQNTAPIDAATADAWLQARLSGHYAAQVDALLAPAPFPIPTWQRGALYSFAWNEGEAALAGSTLLHLLLGGFPDSAAQQFSSWIYAGGQPLRGLRVRRAVEQAVFLGQIGLSEIPTWEPPS